MSEPVRLTNNDFRKLLTKPQQPVQSKAGSLNVSATSFSDQKNSEQRDLRRKKKIFYAELKKQENVRLQELSEKYRDRAHERRAGVNPDYQNLSSPGRNTNGAYHAVAPESGVIVEEQRRRIIHESKFLGGDMEHTHLVKGLDYLLLKKVRSELQSKEDEEQAIATENSLEDAATGQMSAEEDSMAIKSEMARNIYNWVQANRSKKVQRNEMFAPRRMAYVFDLGYEMGDTDIPTTLIRSKAEVPDDDIYTLSVSDIVINKLTEIFSSLREGERNKNCKKRDKNKPLFTRTEMAHTKETSCQNGGLAKPTQKALDDSIYDDVGDYQPRGKTESKLKSNKAEPGSYLKDEEKVEKNEQLVKNKPPKVIATKSAAPPAKMQLESYAECYPGFAEMHDAIDDSDDEVDYMKMDSGYKNDPVGRWDFDTQEEYSDYMSKKEVCPKAAFQYGVKTQDGRRTRKNKIGKSGKAELNREWQQIQDIIQKRKLPKGSGDEPGCKAAKY